MDLYFVRHTTPAIAPGICYGQSDLDVASSFSAEFLKIQNQLKHLETASIYSSPLKRCLKLAQATAEAFDFGRVIVDERLKELDFGDWEMLAWQDIPRTELDIWANDFVLHTPPKGESFLALYQRAKQFYQELVVNNHAEPAIIFTHAGVIRAILTEVLQSDLNQAFELRIDCASVTKIIVDEASVRIAYLNQ